MAALFLAVAGAAAGGSVLGPLGAIVGRLVGALAGNVIDQALFGGRHATLEGPRLSGQVIWATNLDEVANTRIRNYIRPLIVTKEQSPTSAPSPLFP